MDHHCPWVNNCVGENNQKYFVLFTFYICVISLHCITVLIEHFYFLVTSDWKVSTSYNEFPTQPHGRHKDFREIPNPYIVKIDQEGDKFAYLYERISLFLLKNRVSSLWKNHGNLEKEKNFFQTWKNHGI